MLNYIWAFMIAAGVAYGSVQGQEIMGLITDGAIDSAKEAVELCVTMLGVVGMWSGLMNIAKKAGLIDKWTRGLNPFLTFLFPHIPDNHPVKKDIATNMIANILGLGWAATPAGIKAIKGLSDLNRGDKRTATNEMCTFLVINISSLQLIPVNIIAYRSQYGSDNPTAIIGPSLLATLMTTLVAIVLCKVICNKKTTK